MNINKHPQKKRLDYTLNFLQKHVSKTEKITDLGDENTLSLYLKSKGYNVSNTSGDLDLGYKVETKIITAFEIFEHLFSPFTVLNENKGKLVCSVPLRLWFAKEYWNDNDRLDCHYHEFSVRQFNHLLYRTGWKIIDSELCHLRKVKIGSILKIFYPRYYFVVAVK